MKKELQEEAKRLRRHGAPVTLISQNLRVSKSSVCRWVQDIELSSAQWEIMRIGRANNAIASAKSRVANGYRPRGGKGSLLWISPEDAKCWGRTKGEIFEDSATWQAGRSKIRIHAVKVFEHHDIPRVCIVCGYDRHIQISHVKPVSSFPDSALISEINAIENIVSLCPNHHWEFDNGLISIEELRQAAGHGCPSDLMSR